MSAPSSGKSGGWVSLAAFAQPHGVSGRIKVKSFTDPADDFARFEPLTDEAGTVYKLKITGHTQGMAIVSIEGITRREQAELLRGKKLGVMREALPDLPADNQFYTDDLIGLPVQTEDGAAYGIVHAVANYGAGDILEISLPSGKSELFAFTHATFPVVDLTGGRITISPPEILGAEAKEAE